MMASLLALVGCQSEELVSDNVIDNGGKKVILTANIQGSPTTRVALTPDTDNNGNPIIKVAWKPSGEKFYVFGEEMTEFTQVSDNIFEGVLPEPDSYGEYIAAYANEEYMNSDESFFANQYGTLDEKFVFMTSTFDAQSESITFSHYTFIIKAAFTFNGAPLQNITSVVVGEELKGAKLSQIFITPHEGGETLDEDIYIHIPCSAYVFIDRIMKFKVMAGDKEYEGSLTIPENMDFEYGKLYTASVQLKPNTTPYLTFSAEAAQTLKINTEVEGLEYSADGGNSWQTLPQSTEVAFGPTNDLLLRGMNPNGTGEANIIFGNSSVPVACSGDIRTLVNYTDYKNADTGSAKFKKLFYGCKALTSAPELPATTLAANCYERMFFECHGLTAAPALPATTLAEKCYYEMFCSCKALTSAPELPATTLTNNCYYYMFGGCTSLTTAPELPATTLAENCYYNMFSGCTSLTTAPELPATTLAGSCYDRMFYGCTSLTTAPELPATETEYRCYTEMFSGCTNLTKAPKLPAQTLRISCYYQMFNNCSKLNEVTMLATHISASGCLSNWLYNTRGTNGTSQTVYVIDQSMVSLVKNECPSYWNVVVVSQQ